VTAKWKRKHVFQINSTVRGLAACDQVCRWGRERGVGSGGWGRMDGRKDGSSFFGKASASSQRTEMKFLEEKKFI